MLLSVRGDHDSLGVPPLDSEEVGLQRLSEIEISMLKSCRYDTQLLPNSIQQRHTCNKLQRCI
jgi:hypothetical protein